jgi:hypothetical protein
MPIGCVLGVADAVVQVVSRIGWLHAGAAGQGVLLGLAEGRAGLQQLGHGVRGGGGELVGCPGAHRRAPQGGDLAGAVAVAGGGPAGRG